MILDFN